MTVLEKLNSLLFSPLLVICVLAAGGTLFIRFGYVFFVRPKKTLNAFLRKSGGKEGVSPFKSLSVALASTMGVGNIVGVSTAIASGGPGAVFWMIISAVAAMTVKYAEVALGILTRKNTGGRLRGGSPYYFEKYLGRAPAVFFAVLLLINSVTVGNIVQSNALAESANKAFGLDVRAAGLMFFVVCAATLLRKNKRIENVTSVAVASATFLFCFFSLAAIVMSASKLTDAAGIIIKNAFSLKAAASGGAGYTMAAAIRYGVTRGIMSNEAGSGTSPTAHCLSSNGPVEQGLFGIFEVFVDTVVTCTLTALVIILAFGETYGGMTGMELALAAFGVFFGSRAEAILTLSVAVFAYAAVISQYYYGREAVFYITKRNAVGKAFDGTFISCVYLGAVVSSKLLWGLTDLNVCIMTVANCIFLIFRSDEVRRVTLAYYSDGKKRREERDALRGGRFRDRA